MTDLERHNEERPSVRHAESPARRWCRRAALAVLALLAAHAFWRGERTMGWLLAGAFVMALVGYGVCRRRDDDRDA